MTGNATLDQFAEWLSRNWLAIVVGAVLLLLVFRYARPLVRRLIKRIVAGRPQGAGAEAELQAEEAEKRAATIEEVLVGLVKSAVVVTLALVALTLLDLLPVIAGLSVVLAAVTLAGQSIVLDYLMGLLILVEGHYYRGDWIVVGTVEGTVEDVGLRRTVVRDSAGTVHSVSNGLIRTSSNMTRIYAGLLVDVVVDQATDVDRAIAVIDEVGRTMAADPEWKDRMLEVPRFTRIVDMNASGVTMRVVGRVRAADRSAAPGELRRRLLVAFAQNGIELPRTSTVAAPA